MAWLLFRFELWQHLKPFGGVWQGALLFLLLMVVHIAYSLNSTITLLPFIIMIVSMAVLVFRVWQIVEEDRQSGYLQLWSTMPISNSAIWLARFMLLLFTHIIPYSVLVYYSSGISEWSIQMRLTLTMIFCISNLLALALLLPVMLITLNFSRSIIIRLLCIIMPLIPLIWFMRSGYFLPLSVLYSLTIIAPLAVCLSVIVAGRMMRKVCLQ